MDPPTGAETDALRDEKARLLKSVRPLAPADVVRGQFRGYRSEPGVAPDSRVETFAAVRLSIESWRWAGVPFYIRSGKCLPITANDVIVEFKYPPRQTFEDHALATPNHLRLRLGPEVLIALGLRVKRPGERMIGESVGLVAMHQRGDEMLPYERLLGDAMRGDASLFAREDAVEAQWRIVDPVLGNAATLHEYAPGSWGPPEADALIAADGGWLDPQASAGAPPPAGDAPQSAENARAASTRAPS
jgi:glucose-6-phosphate 1-dehydrogenase